MASRLFDQAHYDALLAELQTGRYHGRPVADVDTSRPNEQALRVVIKFADDKQPQTTALEFDPGVNAGPK